MLKFVGIILIISSVVLGWFSFPHRLLVQFSVSLLSLLFFAIHFLESQDKLNLPDSLLNRYYTAMQVTGALLLTVGLAMIFVLPITTFFLFLEKSTLTKSADFGALLIGLKQSFPSMPRVGIFLIVSAIGGLMLFFSCAGRSEKNFHLNGK